MSLTASFLTVLSVVSLLAPSRLGQTGGFSQPLQERLQRQLDSFWRTSEIPGVTAGIALQDGTSLGLAAGYSDLELRTPMKPDDRMLAASVGKTFVAAIVLQLVQQGEIGLDDPLQKWLGKEEWFDRLSNSQDIKVRMLLNHTSGVAPHLESRRFVEILQADRDKVWHPEELISLSLERPALFKAGTDWAYSDTNYILLGMIVERITHQPYYKTLQDRLLKPLGLRDTIPSDSRKVPGLVPGYQSPDSPIGSGKTIVDGRFYINLQYEWTGGGLASTSRDLARWARAVYEGQAFSPPIAR